MSSRFSYLMIGTTNVLALAVFTSNFHGQAPQKPQTDPIAAQVGEHAIRASTVLRFVESKFPKQDFQEPMMSSIRAHSLEHLVRRAIVYQYLVTTGQWADQCAIRLDIETFEKELERADVTLKQHLAKHKISREQFEFETAWRLSWQKYLDKTLTEANLAKYFESKRRQFDGTELKVAHLLLKDDSEAARLKLDEIYEQLQTNPLDWGGLVAQHSQAASKDSAGEIGWIAIDGPMPPDFTKAAFKLDVGQLSKPVRTRLGLHLIKCLEVKPGKKGPLDARAEVMASAKEFLFFKLAADNRAKVDIKYSDKFPRLDENGNVVPRK